jgi:hypothetical protein
MAATRKGYQMANNEIHLPGIGASIVEMQINQTLAGLRVMPQMLPRLEAMAARGDKVAAEVVKRLKAGQP